MSRRESMLSQRTLLAHDRTSTAGSLNGGIPLGSPLRPIEEPQAFPQPPLLDQSLQLIATLLPPALLLLSQLGPTHLFSPPLKIPSLFEVALGAGSSSRKSSMSETTDPFSRSDHMQSDRASIASTATADTATTAASFMPGLPTIDHLRPAHSHELHAPSSLSVPAVSAAAIWRLFRGFEWIGEVGKGEQPRPPSPTKSLNEAGGGGDPFSDIDDEPEQIFDFPSMLQGISDVLAADTAARGIELVIGQVGNGSAPSPAATPSVEEKNAEVTGEKPKPGPKEIESRELLVRADERAWSVALVWVSLVIVLDVQFQRTDSIALADPSSHYRWSEFRINNRSSIPRYCRLRFLRTSSSELERIYSRSLKQYLALSRIFYSSFSSKMVDGIARNPSYRCSSYSCPPLWRRWRLFAWLKSRSSRSSLRQSLRKIPLLSRRIRIRHCRTRYSRRCDIEVMGPRRPPPCCSTETSTC